jgi:hypothetical protein
MSDSFYWTPNSALWQLLYGVPGTDRTESARAYLRALLDRTARKDDE